MRFAPIVSCIAIGVFAGCSESAEPLPTEAAPRMDQHVVCYKACFGHRVDGVDVIGSTTLYVGSPALVGIRLLGAADRDVSAYGKMGQTGIIITDTIPGPPVLKIAFGSLVSFNQRFGFSAYASLLTAAGMVVPTDTIPGPPVLMRDVNADGHLDVLLIMNTEHLTRHVSVGTYDWSLALNGRNRVSPISLGRIAVDSLDN